MRYTKHRHLAAPISFGMQLKRTTSGGFFYLPRTEMMATANDSESGNIQLKMRNKSRFAEQINKISASIKKNNK